MAKEKTLVIQHDGQITVSVFSPFTIGDESLNRIIAKALDLDESDYRRIAAKVKITITLKNEQPNVFWESDD